VSRYRCVDARKAEQFPVAAACEAAGVSTSAYYAWVASCARGPAAAALANQQVVAEIRAIHADSDEVYGSPRVTAELRRRGRQVNHKRVERLMRAHELVGHRPRRRRSLTKPDTSTSPAPDLLGRLFDPDQPDVAWCGDITCIPTDEGWLYLASVIDLASRHLIGWSMSDRHDAGLVTGALEAAVAARGQGKLPGTIFHTDRGAEYTAAACANACERLGLRQSMGRTGSCLDNAAAESFFATLKVELVSRRRYRTRARRAPRSPTRHCPRWPHNPSVRPPGGSPGWLDLIPDLSCTNSTRAHWVDVEHQPTDLVVCRLPVALGRR
jgi:putative transposase